MTKTLLETMPRRVKRRLAVTTLSLLTLLAMLLLAATSPVPAHSDAKHVGVVGSASSAASDTDPRSKRSQDPAAAKTETKGSARQESQTDMECDEWGVSDHVGGFGTCDNGK